MGYLDHGSRGVLQTSSTVSFFQMKKMRMKRRMMKSPAWGLMKKILDLKMRSLMTLFAQGVRKPSFLGLTTV